MSLPSQEIRGIEVTERSCSVLSLLAASFVIISFIGSSHFRTPINRLIFYATWGNVVDNMVMLISRTGISRGDRSSLCQFQAFFLQWFVVPESLFDLRYLIRQTRLVPSDALWSFCMALNIYLAFFHGYDTADLKKMEWKYFILCYAIPFVPAVAFLFIESEARGKFYGSATIWCWISIEWKVFRLVALYGPVWFVIALTLGIYAFVGTKILQTRRQLQCALVSDPCYPSSFIAESQCNELFRSLRDTDIQIRGQATPLPSHNTSSGSIGVHRIHNRIAASEGPVVMSPIPVSSRRPEIRAEVIYIHRTVSVESGAAAWAYTKYAMLFFIALIVTWTPATVYRIHTIVQPDYFNPALVYTVTSLLPLQGFWNSVIYIATSFSAVKQLFTHSICVPKRHYPSIAMAGSQRHPGGEEGLTRYGVFQEPVC